MSVPHRRFASLSHRDEVHVSAASAGVLAEGLVHEGDLVDAGEPIARLYPEVSS